MDHRQRASKWPGPLGLLVLIGLIVAPLLPAHATPPISGQTIEFQATAQEVGSHTSWVDSVAAGDLDGDGDLDLVSGGGDSKVNVWQNDGSPFSGGWASQEVGSHTGEVMSVAAGDLDGDGDLDLVSGGMDSRVYVWRNDGSPFSGAWTPQQVGSHTGDVRSLAVGDLDGDGDLDLVSGGMDTKVNVWRNDGSPFSAAWTKQEVGSHTAGVTSVAAGDLDGDSDMDLVSGGYDDRVNVWENNGSPFGAAWTAQEVGSHTGDVYSVAAGDLDGDGDLDLVSGGADTKVNVWRNDGGPFSGAWTSQEVGSHSSAVSSLAAGDLDGDGDVDLVSGGWDMKANAWQNGHSPFGGTWTSHEVGSHTSAVYSVAVGDLDGDGDLDVVSGGVDTRVNAWQNAQVHRNMPFNHTATEVGSHASWVYSVAAGDLDGDSDLDLVSGGYDDRVNVWENNGSPFSGAWTVQEVGSHPSVVNSVAAGDLDGDGDLDLVSGGGDSKVNVWQNDGSPFSGAWTRQEVGSHASVVNSVAAGDLDGDGDLDLVSGGVDGKVNVWQNDGSPFSGAWTQQEVGSHASWVYSVAAGDLDGDGDLDLVSSGWDRKVNVWQNDGSPFSGAWTSQEVGSHTSGVVSVAAGDLDGDSDLDLVSGGYDDRVNVWENNGSPFSGAWTVQEVGSHTNGVRAVAAGDLDGDGDLDLVSGGRVDRKVNAWQNDGSPFSGAWTQQEVGSHTNGLRTVAAGDLDGDGDLDLVSGGYDAKVNAWQNQGGSAGLAVGDTAPAGIPNGAEEDLLKVVFGHNGIAGDRDLELNRFDLHLFHSDCSTILTSAEANALIARLRVRLDDGDDLFETGGSDLLVADVDALSLAGGVQTLAFADGEASVQLSAGNSKTYWISALTTVDASSQSPSSFCVNFDPDADALVEGKADGLSEPDFSVSQQDTGATNTGAVSTAYHVYLPLVRR